jgi:hypothetical protein
MDEKLCNLILVEPHNHCVNAAEHAIHTFKVHFISALATTNSKFPFQWWDCLTPQVESTLNMMRPSCVDPDISVYEAIHGPYDWNCFPLAPPGCNAIVYKSPDTQGSWGRRGIDAWCISPSLDHYQCNHFFVPETRAYQKSGSAKLFPQHCQVPFLMWNEHLQEVLDKLIKALKEVPVCKHVGVLADIQNKLALETLPTFPGSTLVKHGFLLP